MFSRGKNNQWNRWIIVFSLLFLFAAIKPTQAVWYNPVDWVDSINRGSLGGGLAAASNAWTDAFSVSNVVSGVLRFNTIGLAVTAYDYLRGNPDRISQAGVAASNSVADVAVDLDSRVLDAQTAQVNQARGVVDRLTAQNNSAGVTPAQRAQNVAIEKAAAKASSEGLTEPKKAAESSLTSTTAATLGDTLGLMVAWCMYYIAIGLGWILMLISYVMLKIAAYNDFLREAPVQYGWRLIRDICNNFFIILLLITAVSTMLRRGDFKDWRVMLPKILGAAVIINFTLLMCGILIDISQIFTLTFASPLNSVEGYNVILIAMGLPSGMQLSQLIKSTAGGTGAVIEGGIKVFDLIAALIYAIIVTIVTIVVVVCVTVVLAYRIIMLWFLVMLSPLPVLLIIFKQGSKYANQWWEEFTKYLIVGPVLLFFLYISFMAMTGINNMGANGNTSNVLGVSTQSMGKSSISTTNLTAEGTSDTVSLSNAASPDGVINFLIVVGLLAGSLMMAQKMGVGGSKFAGQGLGWLQKQGKSWSGFNAIRGKPGAVATAIDDRYGIRQKLYGAAYSAGGKYIPFANQALGTKIGSLESGTQKRTNEYYSAIAKGSKVDDMNEAQLRKLATRGGAQGVVAAQALMKKGLLRDDDEANRTNNVDIIKRAREALKGTDLGGTFDENLRKYNPGLAFDTVYKGKMEKLGSDLKTGKLDITKLMGGMSLASLDELKANLRGGDDALAKFIMANADDLSKVNKVMSSEAKNKVWGNVTHDTFAQKDADGNILRDENGKLKYDDDARKNYLSFRAGDIDKVFDAGNDDELKKGRKYFSKNREDILKNMDDSAMTSELLSHYGDMFSAKEFENNFTNRSEEHKRSGISAMQARIDEAIATADFTALATNIRNAANDAARKTATDALISSDAAKPVIDSAKKELLVSGKFGDNLARADGGQEIMQHILGGLNGEQAGKIKWGSLSTAQQNLVTQSLNANALKALTTSGDNNDLVKGIKEKVKSAASADNTMEQAFNTAKQNHATARKKLDDLLAELARLDEEANDLAAAGNTVEANYRRIQAGKIRTSGDVARLTGEEATAGAAYAAARTTHAANLDGENWKKTAAQKRETEIKGKKKKDSNADEDED